MTSDVVAVVAVLSAVVLPEVVLAVVVLGPVFGDVVGPSLVTVVSFLKKLILDEVATQLVWT